MQSMGNQFEPADFSLEELAFLKDHLRETPNVALHGTLPIGVNPAAIKAALGRFHELEELATIKASARAKPQPWAGFEAIEDSIDRFIAWQELSLSIQKEGGPRHPSMHAWDTTGAMTTGGIGTDSVEKVRSEILPDGTRRKFAVDLLKRGGKSPKMPWVGNGSTVAADRIVHKPNGTYECTICNNKVVASYDTDKGRKARNTARAEAVKHLKTSRKEVARHRSIVAVPFE